jgi:acyl-CoA thioesterase FadM
MARVKLDLPNRFAFETELPLRITDINYGQHLGNDALLSLLHEARVRFLNSHRLSEVDVGGCGLIMTDAVIIYKAQAAYGDVLRIQIAVQDFGALGCDLVYRATNRATGAEVARAKTGLVCFDYSHNKPVRAPEKFRAALGVAHISA